MAVDAHPEFGEALADPGRVRVHEVPEEHLGPYGDDLGALYVFPITHAGILQSAGWRTTRKPTLLLERAEAFARSRLSERRYEHTLRVADTAEDLALAHGLDADRARLAALLHDAARETGPEEFLKLAEEWHLQVGDAGTAEPEAAARAGSRGAGEARAWRR